MNSKEIQAISTLILSSIFLFFSCNSNEEICVDEFLGTADLLPITREETAAYISANAIIFRDTFGNEISIPKFQKTDDYITRRYGWNCIEPDDRSRYLLETEHIFNSFLNEEDDWFLILRGSIYTVPKQHRTNDSDTILFDHVWLKIGPRVTYPDSMQTVSFSWVYGRGTPIPEAYMDEYEEYQKRSDVIEEIQIFDKTFYKVYKYIQDENTIYYNAEFGLICFDIKNRKKWIFERFE